MVTIDNIKEIFLKLINDENFCRLTYYGENPFSLDYPDIKSMPDYAKLMKEKIKFAPQIEDLQKKQETRIVIFKGYTQLPSVNSVKRVNTIQIDIYVPYYLQNDEFRIYMLEDKIAELLDGMPIKGVSKLNYIDGKFFNSPVDGYTLYKMLFETEEGRTF